MRTTFAALVFLYLCVSLTAWAQLHPDSSGIASHLVSSFNVEQLNMIDALLQLGQEQEFPIGIEYIDAAAFRSRIIVHEQNTTVGKLLDSITHPEGY